MLESVSIMTKSHLLKNCFKGTIHRVPITEIFKQIISEIFRKRNVNHNLRTQADFATIHANTRIHGVNSGKWYLIIENALVLMN